MQSSSMERRMKGTEGTVKRTSYCYYSEVKNLLNLGKMPFSMSSYFDLQELAKICLVLL